MLAPIKRKLRSAYNGYVLAVLTLGYLSAELGHFLIGVTSKATARDVHYGDVKCQLNKTKPHFNFTLLEACAASNDRSSCESRLLQDGRPYCEWNYNGLGFDYQILAGPSFIAVYTVVGVLLGMAADKYNRSRLLAVSLFVSSLAIILTGVADRFWQLVSLRILLAVGEAGCNPLSTGILSDLFSEEKRALVMSIFNWGIYAGIGLAFPIGRYVTEFNFWNKSWRVPYYFSGAFGLVVAALCTLTVPEPSRKTIGEENGEQRREEKGDGRGRRDAVVTSADEAAEPRLRQNENPQEDSPWKVMLQPRIVVLCVAASLRHTGGICLAYNADLFYRNVFPDYDLGWTLFFVTFVVGSSGVIAGGIASDKIAAKMGIRSRVAVLAISQLIATPFAFGSVYLGPVAAMITLAISYVFAEMWFGVLFTILVEIVPLSVRSTTVGVFLFVMNNVGGNLPILVEPVRKATSFRHSMAIFYAGFYLLGAIFFAAATLVMGETNEEREEKQRRTEEAVVSGGVDNDAFALERIPACVVSDFYETRRL